MGGNSAFQRVPVSGNKMWAETKDVKGNNQNNK